MVEAVNKKTFKSTEPHVEEYLATSKNFRATTSVDEAIAHSNLIYILVATPTGSGDKSYDHSALSKVLFDLNKRKLQDKVLFYVVLFPLPEFFSLSFFFCAAVAHCHWMHCASWIHSQHCSVLVARLRELHRQLQP